MLFILIPIEKIYLFMKANKKKKIILYLIIKSTQFSTNLINMNQ